MEAIRSSLFLLVLAVSLSLVGLVAVGGADKKYSHERLVRIDASRNAVFEWLIDPKLREVWKTDLVSSRSVRLFSPDGFELVEEYEVDGEREERKVEILRNEHGNRVSYRMHMKGAVLLIHYATRRFHTGKACLLEARYEIEWSDRSVLITEPILASKLRARAVEELEALRVAIETSPTH